MSEWNTITLGELSKAKQIEIRTGPFGSQLHQSDYVDNGVPVIMPKDILDWTISVDTIARTSLQMIDKLQIHKVRSGDIVYGRRGDIGRHAFVTNKEIGWLCGTGCIRLRIMDDAPIVPKYLSFFLRLPETIRGICNQAIGATMPNLNTSIIENITVGFPDASDQKKIISALSTYDNLIENNNRRISILEEMAQKLYREWFVHFRFPGHENIKMVESEMGLIPEGWKISPVSEIASLLSGFAFKSGTFSPNGRYNIITIKNVKNSGFDLLNTNFIDEIPHNMPNHCKIVNGDILMSLTGNVGRVCIAYGNNLLLNQRVAKISSEYPCFSYYLFKSDDIFAKLNILANGVAQQNLSPIEAMKIKVCIPEKHKLMQFERAVGRILEELKILYCKNTNLRKTRDLLLPRLISGDIDVSDLDIPVKEG